MTPLVDLVMPVYNEGANVENAVRALAATVRVPKRLLVVYDFDEDDTLPALAPLRVEFPWIETTRNEYGRGVLNAIRWGFAHATADVVIVTMGDLSDDVAVIDRMAGLIVDGGYDVVCASRYMRGGQQIGGPKLKAFLSRLAGVSLYHLAGVPTHDATNAFRAYRREIVQGIPIESRAGFEYSLELTVKAHRIGKRVTEVPATWRHRSAGTSRFRLLEWLPHYIRWYLLAFAPRRRDS